MTCLWEQGLMGMSAHEKWRRMGWVRRHGPGGGLLLSTEVYLIPCPFPSVRQPEDRSTTVRYRVCVNQGWTRGERGEGTLQACLCDLLVIWDLLRYEILWPCKENTPRPFVVRIYFNGAMKTETRVKGLPPHLCSKDHSATEDRWMGHIQRPRHETKNQSFIWAAVCHEALPFRPVWHIKRGIMLRS